MMNEANISATEKALDYIRKRAKEKGMAKSAVHFAVKKTGCSGYSYVLEFTENASESTYTLHLTDDVNIYVDKNSFALLKGTTLDYVETPFGGMMKFYNPNEKGSCGCGESFTTENHEEV